MFYYYKRGYLAKQLKMNANCRRCTQHGNNERDFELRSKNWRQKIEFWFKENEKEEERRSGLKWRLHQHRKSLDLDTSSLGKTGIHLLCFSLLVCCVSALSNKLLFFAIVCVDICQNLITCMILTLSNFSSLLTLGNNL